MTGRKKAQNTQKKPAVVRRSPDRALPGQVFCAFCASVATPAGNVNHGDTETRSQHQYRPRMLAL